MSVNPTDASVNSTPNKVASPEQEIVRVEENAGLFSKEEGAGNEDGYYSTWDEVPDDFKDLYMQSLAKSICDDAKKHQDRMKELQRESRS